MKYLALIFAFCIIGCAEKEIKKSQSWHESMQGLAESFTEILPFAITHKWESSPQTKSKFKKAVKRLQSYSVDLNSVKNIPSNDPTLQYIAKDFLVQVSDLQKNLNAGSTKNLQPQVRNLTRYCIACHTKTRSGSSFSEISQNVNFSGFSNYEKATYYSAVRQYEKALIDYEYSLVNKKWAKNHRQEWNDGVKSLLAIVVRVKKDPNLTVEMLAQFFDTGSYPAELKSAARVWQKQAKAWSREAEKKPNLSRVKRYLASAEVHNKKLKNSGLLLNLRASSELNEILRSSQGLTRSSQQEALYMAGVIGTRMRMFNFGEFPSAYFRACVDVNKKSKLAKKCQKNI